MEQLNQFNTIKGKTITIGNINEISLETQKKIIDLELDTIKFCQSSPEILSQLNFSNSPIKSVIYNYSRNKDFRVIKYDLNNLPNGLEKLYFSSGSVLLGELNNLPASLRELTIKAFSYHHELNNLPTGLKYLNIVLTGTQSLEYLPSGLETLILNFGDVLTKSNEIARTKLDSLPTCLKELIITGNQNYCEGMNNLPIGLKVLHCSSFYSQVLKNLPQELCEIKTGLFNMFDVNTFNNMSKLKKMTLGYERNEHSYTITSFDLELIPDTIEELEFGGLFNQNVTHLPSKLKKLKFGFNFDINIDYSVYPDTLEELIFGYKYNCAIYSYPPNLKYLEFGRNYSQPLLNLPNGLKHLKLNERFNAKIKSLPENLEILEFDEYATYCHNILCIPNSTHTIILSKYFKGLINIPIGLKKITYSKLNTNISNELAKNNYTGDTFFIE